MSSSRPDPITTAAESASHPHAAQGVDPAALQRRLDQLHRAMGLQSSSPENGPASAPTPTHRQPVDVLAALQSPQPKRPGSVRLLAYALAALPLIGLLVWWMMRMPNSQAPAPMDAARVAQTKPTANSLPVAAATVQPSPAAPVTVSPVVAAPAVPDASAILATQEKAVRERVETWRQAWAARDVDAYLAHYGAQFKPLKEPTRAEWAANRRRVISSRPDIVLSLSQMKLQRVDEQRWLASFLQDYASGSYVEKQQPKTLELLLENEQWVIVAERQTP